MVMALALAHAHAQAPAAPSVAQPPPRERYFGIHGGVLIPFAMTLDLQYRLGYAFVSWNPFLVGLGEGHNVLVAAGAGCTWRVTPTSGWHLDVWAIGIAGPQRAENDAGMIVDGFSGAVGVGFGARYTTRRAVELGIRVPLVGTIFSTADVRLSIVDRIVNFYLAAIFALPVFSVGYRF